MPTIEVRMSEDKKEGTEASVGNWLKQAGDTVREHEPLVEISTDKVTLEIAAPVSGVLGAHLKRAGDDVGPGELLATIVTQTEDKKHPAKTSAPEAAPSAAPINLPSQRTETLTPDAATNGFSPAVRKLLAELDLNPNDIPKTSRGTRLTPQDIGAYLKQASPAQASATSSPLRPGRRIPHTPMRRSIASHMTRSVQTAPHVTSVFEADLYNVLADREQRRQATGADVVPSITAYLIRAAIHAIKLFPEVNSKWHDAHLEVFDHVNFGVGTALDTGGLVVPVLHNAHTMDLLLLSQTLREMTNKARAGRLTHADMDGGTFTLSNHGGSGSLLAAPIILPHGQAAILGAGKLQKRPIVCETGGRELFRIRPMMYVTLTVDHRVLDGQQTNGFLTAFVQALEAPR